MTPDNPLLGGYKPPGKRRTFWIFIWIVGILAVVIGGLTFIGYRYATAAPQTRPGFGHPVRIRELSDGFATYRFPELGLDMDLPSIPVADLYQVNKAANLYYQSWSRYRIRGPLNLSFRRVWYRPRRNLTLKRAVQNIESNEKKNHKNLRDLKETETTFGNEPAVEIEATYDGASEPERLFQFVAKGRDAEFAMGASCKVSDLESATRDWQRIVASIRTSDATRSGNDFFAAAP